jgi:hypothetical protein
MQLKGPLAIKESNTITSRLLPGVCAVAPAALLAIGALLRSLREELPS